MPLCHVEHCRHRFLHRLQLLVRVFCHVHVLLLLTYDGSWVVLRKGVAYLVAIILKVAPGREFLKDLCHARINNLFLTSFKHVSHCKRMLIEGDVF